MPPTILRVTTKTRGHPTRALTYLVEEVHTLQQVCRTHHQIHCRAPLGTQATLDHRTVCRMEACQEYQHLLGGATCRAAERTQANSQECRDPRAAPDLVQACTRLLGVLEAPCHSSRL